MSLDSSVEIKSASSGRVWRKVPEIDAQSVHLCVSQPLAVRFHLQGSFLL